MYLYTYNAPPLTVHAYPLTASSTMVELLHPISNASLVIRQRGVLTLQDRDWQVALVL